MLLYTECRTNSRAKVRHQHRSSPNLAIEVDISSSSQRRFNIYLQLRIPEVWRYTQQDGMVIYQLQGNEYVECQFSPTFPYVSGATLWQFLQLAETEDDNGVIRALRQWLKTQVQENSNA
ncbi:MAG: hypothetical protein BRC45_10795 [Cyanobacteria bacterium QS_5_48_63]|nr:MAG: hypothetical protein BRC45_10795 [Cyanobacteria bacterium QS_5_48_63]